MWILLFIAMMRQALTQNTNPKFISTKLSHLYNTIYRLFHCFTVWFNVKNFQIPVKKYRHVLKVIGYLTGDEGVEHHYIILFPASDRNRLKSV